MCLKVTTIKVPNRKNTDGFHLGWKVLRENNSPVFFPKEYTYAVGENVPRDLQNMLTTSFADGERIHQGLHLFLTRKDARAFLKHVGTTYGVAKIVKAYYKYEDIMSYGITDSHVAFASGGTPSVVVKKLTIKSLKGE